MLHVAFDTDYPVYEVFGVALLTFTDGTAKKKWNGNPRFIQGMWGRSGCCRILVDKSESGRAFSQPLINRTLRTYVIRMRRLGVVGSVGSVGSSCNPRHPLIHLPGGPRAVGCPRNHAGKCGLSQAG